MRRKLMIFLVVILSISSVWGQSHIYWSYQFGGGIIQRGNQDGTEITTLISSRTRGIELDVDANKIYWAAPDETGIYEANLDGTNIAEVVNVNSPNDLILDIPNSNIYYTNGDKISRVDFDGTDQMDLITGLSNPVGIDLDGGKLYWCDNNSETINSADLDGSNNQVIVSTNLPLRLALDKINQKVYWVERTPDLIKRSNYDGSNVETVVTLSSATTGIKIDDFNSKIYWAEVNSSAIKRSNLDGTNIETVFDFNNNPGLSGIALNINSLLPLPVELISFEGNLSENEIQLEWLTETENNNAGFQIEKSEDARNWEVISFVTGNGNSSTLTEYAFRDKFPYFGANYYRLKQVDYDGVYEYSKVISIDYVNSEFNFYVYPNPSDKNINININNRSNKKMIIQLNDNLGMQIWNSGLIENELNWKKELAILKNGSYYLSVQIGSEFYYKHILILDKK